MRAQVLARSQKPDVPEITRLLEAITQASPNDVQALVFLGKVLLDSGDYPGAISRYAAAVRLQPNSVDLRLQLASLYTLPPPGRLPDYPRAKEQLEALRPESDRRVRLLRSGLTFSGPMEATPDSWAA